MNSKIIHKRTSEILRRIADECSDGDITFRDFTTMMGDRAFALVILFFSLINSIPIPGIPGVSTITGAPILFVAIQMVWGKDVIWLPEWLERKTLSGNFIRKILRKAIPFVIKIERFLKPRWAFVLNPIGERIVGLCILFLTIVLILPIPGGNLLPGICITILALSFLEKDGLWTLCGIVLSLVSFVVMLELIQRATAKMLSYFD